MTLAQENGILALIGTEPDGLKPIEIQKLMFVYSRQEESIPSYDFIPYRQGCSSPTLAQDIHKLTEKGLVKALNVADDFMSVFNGRAALCGSRDKARPFHTDINPGQQNKYEITDADGVKATHKILGWELGTLFYWEKKRLGSEERARGSVRQKYGVGFLNSDKVDLYLYMGTRLQFQQRHMPNPWTIIGVAPFPKVEAVQQSLF